MYNNTAVYYIILYAYVRMYILVLASSKVGIVRARNIMYSNFYIKIVKDKKENDF